MFTTKLTLAFAAMLAFVLFLAGVLFWGANRSTYYLHRSQLAHYNLEAYLRLSDETYHHFKQLADIVMIDDWRPRIDVSPSRRSVDDALDRIRELTTAERDLVDDEEVASEEAELEGLRQIEQVIDEAQSEFLQVIALFDAGRPSDAWPRLSELLQTRIDGSLAELIDAAILEEEREVAEADSEAQALLSLLTYVAWLTAAASVVFVALSGFVLLRRLRAPMRTLLDGTHKLSHGSLDHRITISGRDEFASLADGFNQMAAKLEEQRCDLLEARAGLERKVAKRTEELNDANAALRQTDSERRRFLADVSHELRTPLTVIRGEAEVTLRRRNAPSEEYREALDRIVDLSGQLARLVDDLLLMARAQGGAARMTLTALSLTDLLTKTCRDASVLLNDHRVEIVRPDGPDDIIVSADSGRLIQLFFILIDNAVRYSKPDGRISIEIAHEEGAASIRVIDEGPGIPAKEIPHLFERYYRSEDGRRISPEGAGLGLPLARAIVEAHGGTIAIDSNVGEGTAVTVTLPISSAAKQSA